jgi:hypothetical protein
MKKEIIIYKIETDFNFPLFKNHSKHVSSGPGDLIYAINNEVYVRDWGGGENTFEKVLCGKEFIELNPEIFKKQ